MILITFWNFFAKIQKVFLSVCTSRPNFDLTLRFIQLSGQQPANLAQTGKKSLKFLFIDFEKDCDYKIIPYHNVAQVVSKRKSRKNGRKLKKVGTLKLCFCTYHNHQIWLLATLTSLQIQKNTWMIWSE